jgi:Polyketide cyclase / dehydrase and lipid transport
MHLFDVQGIEIHASPARVFEFIRDPGNLPRWAHAFKSVQHGKARLETPAGAVDVRLHVLADADCGTVDWRMEFPDGSVGIAQSRVTETARSTSIYSFVLHAPPVPLEEVEGALDTQRVTLRSELSRLKELIEG